MQFTPRWAIIWWFIPILNLWKPYQVTVEIIKSSDPTVGRTDSTMRGSLKETYLGPNLVDLYPSRNRNIGRTWYCNGIERIASYKPL